MSILSDFQVHKLVKKREILVDPYFDVFQGPNCYHCHLGQNFKKLKSKLPFIDPLDSSSNKQYDNIKVTDSYKMLLGEFILGETFEYLGTSSNYVIKLLNSSSLARVGISQAALGMINAGCGTKSPIKITLELINNSSVPVILKPTKILKNGKIIWGTEVLKITIIKMDKPPLVPYDLWKYGVYSKDKNVQGTKMANRFPKDDFLLPKDSLYNTRMKHD